MSRTSKALQASKRNKLGGRGSILTPRTTIMRVGEITSNGDMVRRYGRTISTVEHLTTVERYTIDQIKAAIAEGSWSVHSDV